MLSPSTCRLLPRRLVLLAALAATLVGASSAAAAGGSIAFIREANIWIANPDGSGARQLTTDGAGASAYTTVSAAKGTPLLAYLHGGAPGTIGADGTANHQLPFPNREPRNSASIHIDAVGQRLTWVTNEVGATYGVGLNVDGSSPVIFGTGAVFNTTWDDNQGTALYSSDDYNCDGVLHNHLTIETPKADNGTNMPNPGTYICSSGLSFYYPDVSPNLQQIAVTVDTNAALIGDPTNQIMVLANTPATSGGTTITPSGLGATKPNWSPDGTTIAFQGTGGTIWTVPATGGTPVKILDNAASPAWTPYSPTATGGDTSAPAITITSPAGGAQYAQHQVVNASYSCTDPDGAADVATCAGPVASGSAIDTSTVGSHAFAVNASDHAGNKSARTVNYTVALAGGGGGGVAPAVAGLNASPSAFAAANKGASIARKTGTTISYRDSQAATTTFTVLKRQPGVKNKRGGCVTPTKGKRGKRCTRYVSVGSFTHSDAAGHNSFHFTGRVSGRKLKPGSYKLQVLPRANGKTGPPKILEFRVIK
jgi:hypothetical protein